MFNLTKTKKLQQEIEFLKSEIKHLESVNKSYIEQNSAMKDKMTKQSSELRDFHEVYGSKKEVGLAVVDFKTLKPFSIERVVSDGVPITLIAYFHPTTNEYSEVRFCLTKVEHEELVNQFKTYIKQRKSA